MIFVTCWFVEAYAKCIFHDWYSGREFSLGDSLECIFNIGFHSDTYEPISFKLGMNPENIKLSRLIPAWMILNFTQGHRVTGRLRLVQTLCCWVEWSSPNFCSGWFCKGDDCKSSYKYCECGLFQHLFLFFFFFLVDPFEFHYGSM